MRQQPQQLQISASKKPALLALGVDAKVAGEMKDVAKLVYPEASENDPEKARDKLANALSANHAQKLDIDELVPIVVQAALASGRSALIEHLIAQLPKDCCEFRWVTKEEQMARVTVKLSELLPQCASLFQQAQRLMGAQK